MIERLTYLCGIAVAVISWAIGQLVTDLTAVPVLYMHTNTSSIANTSDSETTLELRNLSRSKRIISLNINVLAPPATCPIAADNIRPGGTEWTLESSSNGGVVPVVSLMPGSLFFVNVTHQNKCKVQFGLGFTGDVVVRTIESGMESFLLFNWLKLILALLILSILVFAGALAKAYRLSAAAASGSGR